MDSPSAACVTGLRRSRSGWRQPEWRGSPRIDQRSEGPQAPEAGVVAYDKLTGELKAFKPLASAELLEAANNWAPIALVDGRLFIRDQKQMKCVQVAQQVR